MTNRKIYEKAEFIGSYYIFWLLFQLVPIFFLSEFASKLFSADVTRMPVVINMMWKSIVVGLFLGGMSLIDFNATIARMSPNEISHKVRSYYINPFVITFLSFIISLGIWLLEKENLIVIKDGIILTLIAVIIGGYSMQASNKLEWLIFRDYLDK